MVFGSKGRDRQDPCMLQFNLNRMIFSKSVQEAIEAAKFFNFLALSLLMTVFSIETDLN